MKCSGLLLFALVLAGILIAGCTQSPLPTMNTPVTATTVATTAAPTPALQPSFTLGDIYLDDLYGYTFNTEKDGIERSFLVDNPSWGISLKVIPKNNESAADSWFVMDVINTNTRKMESFGYGRNFSVKADQLIPMYNQGPYKITMKGNQVKVWVTVAKRNP